MIKTEELEKILIKYKNLEDQLNSSIDDKEKYVLVSKEYSELKPTVEQINILKNEASTLKAKNEQLTRCIKKFQITEPTA